MDLCCLWHNGLFQAKKHVLGYLGVQDHGEAWRPEASDLHSVMAERHTKNSRYLHDFVLGFADGLTVPFAITTGFSSLGSQKLVIIGGLAELLSGAISMGLGAYLAAMTDRQHYQNELRREQDEVEKTPGQEKEEIYQILCAYGPGREAVRPFVEALCKDKKKWIEVCMVRATRPPKQSYAVHDGS